MRTISYCFHLDRCDVILPTGALLFTCTTTVSGAYAVYVEDEIGSREHQHVAAFRYSKRFA